MKGWKLSVLCVAPRTSFTSNSKDDVENSNELVMYEPSEMTILMRKIHEVNKIVKDQIIKNDSLLIFPEDFTKIFSATLTDSTERDDEFIILVIGI